MAKLLITGGTGSFGTAALDKFYNDPRFDGIVVFSRDEKKQFDLMQTFKSPRVKFIVGDTRFYESILEAMDDVNVVFHAAALKQVPTGEFFPLELVKTNILGTENVFRAARESGVKKVILLSTDKAVYPINAMGMTKALAEKLMTAYSMRDNSPTVFCAVRYGNVMASRGSVIPLFVDQIKTRKDLTITDPQMTRFVLSMNEAIDLVELALRRAGPGDIFIRKAPAATIETIAAALKDIFNAKNRVKVVGVRTGEKIHEVLASGTELAKSKDFGDFFRVQTRPDWNYDKYFSEGSKQMSVEDYTSDKARRLSEKELKKIILKLPYIKSELK